MDAIKLSTLLFTDDKKEPFLPFVRTRIDPHQL